MSFFFDKGRDFDLAVQCIESEFNERRRNVTCLKALKPYLPIKEQPFISFEIN